MIQLLTYVLIYYMLGGIFTLIAFPILNLGFERWWEENKDGDEDDELVKMLIQYFNTFVFFPLCWPYFALELIVAMILWFGRF